MTTMTMMTMMMTTMTLFPVYFLCFGEMTFRLVWRFMKSTECTKKETRKSGQRKGSCVNLTPNSYCSCTVCGGICLSSIVCPLCPLLPLFLSNVVSKQKRKPIFCTHESLLSWNAVLVCISMLFLMLMLFVLRCIEWWWWRTDRASFHILSDNSLSIWQILEEFCSRGKILQ